MFYKLANQKKKKKKKSPQSNADLYLSSINIATWTTSHPPLKSQTLIMSKALFNEPYLPRVSSTELAGTVF